MERRQRLALLCFSLFCMFGLLVLLVPTPTQADELAAEPFIDYYWQHHGERVLGRINSPVFESNGYRMQYFERGRLEDHRHETGDPVWIVRYSPLTVELMEQHPYLPVDGMPITYGDLKARSAPTYPPPPGFVSGTMPVEQGVFVPADPALNAAPGFVVPFQFWTYINRSSFYPTGWQHGAGMPLTSAFEILVPDGNGGEKRLVVQAFENTVLTLDLSAVYGWPVTPVNIGSDAVWASGGTPTGQPAPPAPPFAAAGPRRIEVSLERQWLYAYEGDRLMLDAPVSTGKDGFETPPGQFAIYAKVPKQTLSGRYNGESWNVPDVPSILFYHGGFAIHGVYWHDRFGTGERLSHGCVGLAPADAATLYEWAERGTPIRVY